MPQDLIVEEGTQVTLNENPPQAIAEALQRIKINKLSDLIEVGAVSSRDVLDKLLVVGTDGNCFRNGKANNHKYQKEFIMGKSLDQITTGIAEGDQVGVTIITNQDNGIASYATGSLIYHPSSLIGPFFRPARLSTTGGEPLKYYLSDRMLNIDGSPPPGDFFGPGPRQPFSANATDKLGVSISLGPGPRIVKFTLHSWGNATFSVSTELQGNLLVGVGPPVGNLTDHAVYVISFPGVFHPPH